MYRLAALVGDVLAVAGSEATRIGVPARLLDELRDLVARLDSAGLGHQDLSAGYRAWAAAQARPGPGAGAA